MNKILRIPSFSRTPSRLLHGIVIAFLAVMIMGNPVRVISATTAPPTRRVNVPYLGASPENVTSFTPAIFWFGQVDPTSNYADVRVYYYDNYVKIVVHIIDRQLWQDNSDNPANLSQWDGISLYLNKDGNTGSSPGLNSYRFELELSNLQVSYRGNGSGWTKTTLPFTTSTDWRGDQGPNSGVDAKGWIAYFEIPFSSLGLSSKPATDTLWGFAAVMHDRDNASGSELHDTVWPEVMNPTIPSSWGQMHFGEAENTLSSAVGTKIYTIQDGLNGGSGVDADVGGHTTCGDTVDHWTEWGFANYAGYSQVNIQNQWDVSDWPCFSKYYITFSLNSLPRGLKIVSANFTMYLTGNAGGGGYGDPPNSYILALTVGEDWDENTINWNNAPLAIENISGTWVYPKTTAEWPAYTWNINKALAEAYQSGSPLRLVFYSIDGEMHSGKYFSSSDWSEVQGRPFIKVTAGDLCSSPGVNCTFNYLPLIKR